MERLTHGRVKIDSDTKLVINGSEVLSQKGIQVSREKVGVSFGTGRHTDARMLDLTNQLSETKQESGEINLKRIVPGERILPQEPLIVPESPSVLRAKSPHVQHRGIDAGTSNYYPDVQSEGCDPILKSVKSQ